MSLENYTISDSTLRRLKTLCGLPEMEPELPKAVQKQYMIIKMACDRIGHPVGDRELLMAVLTSGYLRQVPDPKPPTIQELWQTKRITRDDLVLARWRGEEKEGLLKGVTREGRPVVAFVGSAEEYEINPGHCRPLPEGYKTQLEKVATKG